MLGTDVVKAEDLPSVDAVSQWSVHSSAAFCWKWVSLDYEPQHSHCILQVLTAPHTTACEMLCMPTLQAHTEFSAW